jgi:hypothetical protein
MIVKPRIEVRIQGKIKCYKSLSALCSENIGYIVVFIPKSKLQYNFNLTAIFV